MHKKSHSLIVILILLSSAGLTAFMTKSASGEGCVTGQCHSTLLKAKNVHPIAETCDSCHQAVETQHPQKDKKTFKLLQDPPELCYSCHTPFGKKQTVHPPVKSGMCTSCHNPHSSDESKLLVQPLKDLCIMCHSDKTSQKYVHGPTATGDCTTCHAPHESDNKALVIKEVTELCTTCHTDIQSELNKKVVHPAVLNGCPSCHNPHTSPFKKLLSAEGEKLCFQCHPQIGEKIEKSTSIHPPIKSEKACASCHSPHAGDVEKLLPKTGKDLCLDCHKTLLKNKKVIHGPIREGKCTPCHDPHGSQYQKLLAKEFPGDLYVPYNENEYQLCFSCHNRDLLRFPDTSFATGFRDGEKNLHYLHVNKKDKGRNCRSCHIIHESDMPKLIGDKISFGKWNLPLNYVKSETGGSCSPGCHKKQNYDRKTPGKEPEPEKPAEKSKGREKTKEPEKPK